MSDLQEGVAVNGNGTITGTLKYVTGYTGFSGEASEQSGNYLAIKFTAEEGAEVSATLGEKGPVDLTDDMYLVARIADPEEVLTITATVDGESTVKAYSLRELVLEEE